MIRKYHYIVFLVMVCIVYKSSTAHPMITLPPDQAQRIGKKIWYNECACSTKKLTWWKEGEEFPSLGIGHFIWFPAYYQGPFIQTFPSLLTFLRKRGVAMPLWLNQISVCPWNNRTEFFNDFTSTKMNELRTILVETIDIQIQFITKRLCTSLPLLFKQLASKDRLHVKKQFYRVAQSPMGFYSLIDYTHFKGEGINPKESYNGNGWGLLQVLMCMQGNGTGKKALEDFVQAAKKVLTERVRNSPSERNEQRWLRGWNNRVDTYLKL